MKYIKIAIAALLAGTASAGRQRICLRTQHGHLCLRIRRRNQRQNLVPVLHQNSAFTLKLEVQRSLKRIAAMRQAGAQL